MTTEAQRAAYEQARKEWVRAIEQRLPHLQISARWDAVVVAAKAIGVTPGWELTP